MKKMGRVKSYSRLATSSIRGPYISITELTNIFSNSINKTPDSVSFIKGCGTLQQGVRFPRTGSLNSNLKNERGSVFSSPCLDLLNNGCECFYVYGSRPVIIWWGYKEG